MPKQLSHIDQINPTLRRGEIATFNATAIFEEQIAKWNLNYLQQHFAQSRIFSHGTLLTIANEVIFNKKKPKPKHLKYLKDVLFAKSHRLGDLLHALHDYKDICIDNSFTELTADKLKRSYAYGVTNVNCLKGVNLTPLQLFNQWRMSFNFLWVGLSAGVMHYDELDNFLAQINGTKEVIIFSPRLTNVIDGHHFPTSFDPSGIFAKQTLDNHPFLKYLPYYRVKLNPGDGVVIPSGAYHLPLATSYDSLSINTFLVPKIFKGIKPHKHGKAHKHKLLTYNALWASRKIHQLCGLGLFRVGPYEFI